MSQIPIGCLMKKEGVSSETPKKQQVSMIK
jgi:hypothetical protein